MGPCRPGISVLPDIRSMNKVSFESPWCVLSNDSLLTHGSWSFRVEPRFLVGGREIPAYHRGAGGVPKNDPKFRCDRDFSPWIDLIEAKISEYMSPYVSHMHINFELDPINPWGEIAIASKFRVIFRDPSRAPMVGWNFPASDQESRFDPKGSRSMDEQGVIG